MPIESDAIKEIVRANLKDIDTVKDIAERLNIPVDTLRKHFARKERIPLSRFILCEKIERIKSQLLETDEKCLTICLGVGWREDVGAKIFKRIVGMTMMEYRDPHTGMDKIAGGAIET